MSTLTKEVQATQNPALGAVLLLAICLRIYRRASYTRPCTFSDTICRTANDPLSCLI